MAKIQKITVGSTTYDVGGDSYTAGAASSTQPYGGGLILNGTAFHETYREVTLPAFTAAGSKDVTVTGCTANSHPVLDVVTSTTQATAETQIEAWSHIYAAQSKANAITFYSDGATTQITVAVKGY